MATATDRSPRPILDLDALAVREHQVRINGNLYGLRNPEEFDVIPTRTLAIQCDRHDALSTKPAHELAPEEAKELEGLIHDICSSILDAPAKVIGKLSDGQRKAVILTFTALSSRGWRTTRASEPTAHNQTPTGETSPLDSVASTAALPVSG